jgi:hypothetical protein
MKKLLKNISFFLIGIGIGITTFSSTGCATLNYLQYGDVKTAVRIATILYIDNDVQRAEDVLYVIRETRKDIDQYQEITIAKAGEFVRTNIVWTKLDPIEAIAAEIVISKIEAAINNEIKHAQIPPNKLVLVRDVFNWIEDAAILSVYYKIK